MRASTHRLDQSSVALLRHPRWSELDWLVHGFSTRQGGLSTVYGAGGGELNLGFTSADDRELVLKNRKLLLQAADGDSDSNAQLKTLSQIHSSIVQPVKGAEEVPPGDGMVTATPGLYLAIQTADCVPVLLVDEKQRVVAAVHAGWRGTVKGIAEAAVAAMKRDFGSRAEDMSAVIGPAIGPCCYEVGEELRLEFASAFPYADELFRSSGGSANRFYLDLGEANRRQLTATGLKLERIYQLGGCTSCQPETFFSHRQSRGQTGRMMSVIGIRSSESTRAGRD